MKSFLHWFRVPLFEKRSHTTERRATWLELFYDVAYVAVIAELALLLERNMSFEGVLLYALLYAPVWWLWIGDTFYADRFDYGTKQDRLFAFLQMIPVGGLAISVHNGLSDFGAQFVLWYMLGRGLLTLRWWRVGFLNPIISPISRTYVLGFSGSLLLWGSSLLLPAPSRYVLWCMALFVEFITPLFTVSTAQRKLPLNESHLTERFGLFTIIVLAEVFIGVVHGLSGVGLITLYHGAVGLFGFVIACCLWSIYFDDIISHPRLPRRPWQLLWIYGHLPLTLCITAIGACTIALVGAAKNHIDQFPHLLMGLAVALALLWIALIEIAHQNGVDHHENEHHEVVCTKLRFVGVFLALAAAVIGLQISSLALCALLAVILFHQVVHGMYVRR